MRLIMADKLKTDIRNFARKERPEPILVEGQGATPSKAKRAGAGRPPKPKAVKRGERITLSLTTDERAIVSEKAGLVPEATFLLNELIKAGVFDRER